MRRARHPGAIATLIVDMDEVVPGTVDETDGRVSFSDVAGADSYGVIDEIACRALLTGARVLSARRPDIPREASLAAILRHPVYASHDREKASEDTVVSSARHSQNTA